MTRFLVLIYVVLCATATSMSNSKHMKSTSTVPNESRNSKPKNHFFITQRMRRVLEDDLLYTTEEVDGMDPSIAAVIIKRGLARPMPGGMPPSWKKRRVWPLINEKARAKLKARLQKIGDQMKDVLHKIGEQLNNGINRIEDTWEDHGAPMAGQIRRKLGVFRRRLQNRWILLKTKLTAPATFAVTQVLPKILLGGASWLILPRIIDAVGFCASIIIGALQMTASIPIRLLPLLSLPKREKVWEKQGKLPSSMTSKSTEEVPKKETLSQPSSPIETSKKLTAEMMKRLSALAAEKVVAVSKFEDARRQREARDAARKQQQVAETARKEQREALELIRRQQEAKDAAHRQQVARDTAQKQQEAEKAAYEQQRETDEAIRRRQQEAEDRKLRREADEIARKQRRAEEERYRKQRVAELAEKMKAAKISAAALEQAQREAKSKLLSQSKSSVKEVNKKQLASTTLPKVSTSIKPGTLPAPSTNKNSIKPKPEVTLAAKKKIDKRKVDLEMLSKVLR